MIDIMIARKFFTLKVAICAGCNTVNPWAGFVIGLVAGAVFMMWSFLMEKAEIDDPLDAFAGTYVAVCADFQIFNTI